MTDATLWGLTQASIKRICHYYGIRLMPLKNKSWHIQYRDAITPYGSQMPLLGIHHNHRLMYRLGDLHHVYAKWGVHDVNRPLCVCVFFYSLGCRIGGTHKDVSSFSQQLQSMGDTFFSLKEESCFTLQSKGLPTLMTAIPFNSSIKIQAQLSGVCLYF